MIIANMTDVVAEVPIENIDTKQADVIFVQPKGRVTLPAGYTVEPTFKALNPRIQLVA
jgi:hypothetical protein